MRTFLVIAVFCAFFAENAQSNPTDNQWTEEYKTTYKTCIIDGGYTKEKLAAFQNWNKTGGSTVKCFEGCRETIRQKRADTDHVFHGHSSLFERVRYVNTYTPELKNLMHKCGTSYSVGDPPSEENCQIAQDLEKCYQASNIEN